MEVISATQSAPSYLIMDHWKVQLIRSFEGITYRKVSEDHDQLEKLAKQCIRNGGTYKERYQLIDFEKVLSRNKKLNLKLMITYFDVLLKYIIDLLIPDRPQKWYSINTDSSFFQSRVACVEGYDEILKKAGFTEKDSNFLQFPKHVKEPDKKNLSILAAELLMAKLEVEQKGSAQRQTRRDSSTSTSSHRPCTPDGDFPHISPEPLRRPSSAEPLSPSTKQDYKQWYNGSQYNFIDPPDDNLFCKQCKQLAYEPHHCCLCFSLFCKKCTFLSTCPVCKKRSDNVFDKRSNALIRELSVRCPNSVSTGLGCSWIGELRDVSHHQMICQWVVCKYSVVGCDHKMYYSMMDKHMKEHRDFHLNLAMEKVISLTVAVEELQERVKQLEGLQERVKQLEDRVAG